MLITTSLTNLFSIHMYDITKSYDKREWNGHNHIKFKLKNKITHEIVYKLLNCKNTLIIKNMADFIVQENIKRNAYGINEVFQIGEFSISEFDKISFFKEDLEKIAAIVILSQ